MIVTNAVMETIVVIVTNVATVAISVTGCVFVADGIINLDGQSEDSSAIDGVKVLVNMI
jgi:hypothetical protein